MKTASLQESKNIGIWIRVSTEDQAQGDSPEHHLERAKAYAISRGWTVKEIYDLAGQSGKAVSQHAECKRMMKDIERGHITGLVFSKLARLSRNRRELEDFSDFFRKHNADLISLSEAIDTSTAGGRMFFHLLGVFAQWEREEITERVNASVITRAKLGKSINGSAPYGYQWKDRKLVIKPEEAAIRCKAYDLFILHRRKGVVAKLLNAAGYRTRGNVIWRDTQVWRILIDPSAKGIYYFNRMKQTGTWRTEAKPEDQWGKAECEPIISETLWNQANQIIEEQLKSWKRPGKAPVQLFGSLAHCKCGHKMYAETRTSKYLCRKCNNKIPIVDLESIFHDELKAFFAEPKRIANHLQNAKKNLSEKQVLLTAHEKEIQKVRDQMTRTHQLYLDGGITTQGFGQFYKPAEERLNQLSEGLPKLQAEVDFLTVNQLSADDVLHEANTLYDRWPQLPLEDKRKIAESLVEKITIGDKEIDITFSYLPSSEEACKNQQGLVALLGITERSIRISRGQNAVRLRPTKAIPTAIKTLGDYLLVKRYEKGLKQGYIAQMVGVTISTVRQWEMDVQKPTREEWAVLVKVLGLENADLETVIQHQVGCWEFGTGNVKIQCVSCESTIMAR